MKVIAVIASFNRDEILRDCILCIAPQVDNIIIVGSSNWVSTPGMGSHIEKQIAIENDLIYVDHANNPLGRKWQAGLNRAREEGADAVLICGSDDLIPVGYVEFLKSWCPADTVWGSYRWNVYNTILNKMVRCEYRMRADPIGAGRIIPKSVLDKLDWEIFPVIAGQGCDLYSYNRLHKVSVFYNSPALQAEPVLCVKGGWDCMDTWDQILDSPALNVQERCTEFIPDYLADKFPAVDFDKYTK